MMATVFPSQFQHLEKYAEWALPTERERLQKKCKTPMPLIQEVDGALESSIDGIFAYLDKIALDEVSGPDERLMDFACCFATLDISVSGWGTPDLEDIFPVERWEVVEERW
jgi:hypothetical protein